MTEDKVVTHATEPYNYKRCRCIVCEEEAICKPSWDFYHEEPNGPLKCEGCMAANLEAIGLNLTGIFDKLSPGMKVRVTQGLLEGEEGIVRTTGRFPTLEGTKSPPTVMVDFSSETVEEGYVTIGKLAGDLEIIS